MFIITKKWLEENQTSNGGYTADQLAEFGFNFPPPRGWQKSIIGKRTTINSKLNFEFNRNSRRSGKLIHAKKAAYVLTEGDLKELEHYIKQLCLKQTKEGDI